MKVFLFFLCVLCVRRYYDAKFESRTFTLRYVVLVLVLVIARIPLGSICNFWRQEALICMSEWESIKWERENESASETWASEWVKCEWVKCEWESESASEIARIAPFSRVRLTVDNFDWVAVSLTVYYVNNVESRFVWSWSVYTFVAV